MNKIKFLKVFLISLLLAPVMISCGGGGGSNSSSNIVANGDNTITASKALKKLASVENITDGGSYIESGENVSCAHIISVPNYSVQGRDKICVNFNQVEINPEEKAIIYIDGGDFIGAIDLSNDPAKITIVNFDKAIKALKDQAKRYECDITQPEVDKVVVSCSGENLDNDGISVVYNSVIATFKKESDKFVARLSVAVSNDASVEILSKSDLGVVPPVIGSSENKKPNLVDHASEQFTVNKLIETIIFNNTGGAVSECTSAPAFPSGLSVSANNNTCQITGTPTDSNFATTYKITATNSEGNDTADIEITVAEKIFAPNLGALNPNTFTFIIGSKIESLSFVNTGGVIKTCTVSSPLPEGLNINPTSCEITGTPTISKGSEQYTVTANNSSGNSNVLISIEVRDDTVSADIENSLESATGAVWTGSSLKKGGEYINENSEIQKCNYTVVVTVIDQGNQTKEQICLELRKVQKNPEEDKFQYYGYSENNDNDSALFVGHIDVLEGLSENQGNVITTLRNAKNALDDQVKVYGACQVLQENIGQETATIRCQGEHLKGSYISYKGPRRPLVDQKTADHRFEADLEGIITDSDSESAKSDEFFGMVRIRPEGDSKWHLVSATEGTVSVKNDNSSYSKLDNSTFDITVNKGGRIKLDLLRDKSVTQVGDDSLSVEEIAVEPKKGTIIVESGVYYYKPNEDENSRYADTFTYSAKSRNSGELSYAIASLNVNINTNVTNPPTSGEDNGEAPVLKHKCRVGWFGTDQDLRLKLTTSAVFKPGHTIQIKALSPVEFRRGTVSISVDHKFIAFKFGYATGIATNFNYTLKYANSDAASEVGTVLAISSLYRDEFKDDIDYKNCKITVNGTSYPKEEARSVVDIK